MHLGEGQDVQFLPEVDTYLKLNSMFQVYNQMKDDRDGGDSTQITSGPSVQLYLKPLLKLKKITTFDLDDAKPRALVLEAGYRYITAPNEPLDNRLDVSHLSLSPEGRISGPRQKPRGPRLEGGSSTGVIAINSLSKELSRFTPII